MLLGIMVPAPPIRAMMQARTAPHSSDSRKFLQLLPAMLVIVSLAGPYRKADLFSSYS